MTQAQHTPGPWKAVNKGPHLNNPSIDLWDAEHGNDGEMVVDEIIASGAYTEANANLIAAAPELLEALKWAEMMIDNIRNGRGCGKIEGDDCQAACKAAIAKAEGGAA